MSDKPQPRSDPKPAPKSDAKPAPPTFAGWGEVRKSVQDWVDKHTPQGTLRKYLGKAGAKSGGK